MRLRQEDVSCSFQLLFLSPRAERGGISLLIIVLDTRKEQQQHKERPESCSARKRRAALLDFQQRENTAMRNASIFSCTAQINRTVVLELMLSSIPFPQTVQSPVGTAGMH